MKVSKDILEISKQAAQFIANELGISLQEAVKEHNEAIF